ncbi:MAG: hypothetical protein O3A87_09750 [Verrucomicrobia bacterium]|nr:hypothetical protein [Verrucomicrobiota bacterium]MDA1006741.1 hypothetical protein [Verrucomicrobiota bacterium]
MRTKVHPRAVGAPVRDAMPAGVRARGRWIPALAALLVSQHVMALPDHLTAVAANPHTGAQVTLELERYNLRAPNWECRIYTSPTSYSALPAGEVPEVATYRGRTSDGGMVCGGVRPDGTLYALVNYGCRPAGAGNSDPYEGAERYSWTMQPPFPRPPVRPDGWLRDLPQKQITSSNPFLLIFVETLKIWSLDFSPSGAREVDSD